jgi:hypothetical protein
LEIVGKSRKARVQTAKEREHHKANSVFCSADERFDVQYQAKDPKVRLLSSKNRRAKKFVSVTNDKKAIMCD